MAIALILLLALLVAEGVARLVSMIAADGLGYRDNTDLPRSHQHALLDGLG